jgi:hypothetical protein
MLIVIPVSEGETHTAYSWSCGEYVEGQESITLDQLNNIDRTNAIDISEMTPRERYLWLVEDAGYYTFSLLAVVDEDKLPMIERVADKMSWGESSGEYELFNEMVMAAAEKTIPFYGDVIEVDPDY